MKDLFDTAPAPSGYVPVIAKGNRPRGYWVNRLGAFYLEGRGHINKRIYQESRGRGKGKRRAVQVAFSRHSLPNRSRPSVHLAHRVLAESLSPWYREDCHVHHIDGDVINCTLDNLICLSREDHELWHEVLGTGSYGRWAARILKQSRTDYEIADYIYSIDHALTPRLVGMVKLELGNNRQSLQ